MQVGDLVRELGYPDSLGVIVKLQDRPQNTYLDREQIALVHWLCDSERDWYSLKLLEAINEGR